MRASRVVSKLLQAAPESAAWRPLAGEPYGPSGVDPDVEVRRVLYCVTTTPEVEDFFHQGRYDLLVAHHPFRPLSLIPNVMLHTPLDCCPGGLNDLWREALDIQDARPVTDNLGWSGPITPVRFDDLVGRVRSFAGDVVGQVRSSKRWIESAVICTGLGGVVATEVEATGADVFVTGELVQPADSLTLPAVVEVGHTLSERVGVASIRRFLGPEVDVDAAPLGVDRFGEEVFAGGNHVREAMRKVRGPVDCHRQSRWTRVGHTWFG